MKKYEVKLVMELSKVIEANSREEALELWDEVNAGTRQRSFTAKVLKDREEAAL